MVECTARVLRGIIGGRVVVSFQRLSPLAPVNSNRKRRPKLRRGINEGKVVEEKGKMDRVKGSSAVTAPPRVLFMGVARISVGSVFNVKPGLIFYAI